MVGGLDLTYLSFSLPGIPRAVHELSVYTAEPGTSNEERIKVLTSWAATAAAEAEEPSSRQNPAI